MQRRATKRRVIERCNASLQEEESESLSWTPPQCMPIILRGGIKFSYRCDQLIKAHTTYATVHHGVSIVKSREKVSIKWRNKHCSGALISNLQPKSGQWKLNKISSLIDESKCAEQRREIQNLNAEKGYCAPAYTPRQVSRFIMNDGVDYSTISPFWSLSWLKRIISTGCIPRKSTSVPFEMIFYYTHLSDSRSMDMASINKYADLLRGCVDHVKRFTVDGARFWQERIQFAQRVFTDLMEQKRLATGAQFNKYHV